jgi:predicted alpha/beta-hydrolase family hydrolase
VGVNSHAPLDGAEQPRRHQVELACHAAERTVRSGYDPAMSALGVQTPHGPARVYLHAAAEPVAALVLGHGAGGGIGARDLTTATEVALSMSLTTALMEQPYKVAGRRSPAPANQLDAAWKAVVSHLGANELSGMPLIVGGRSAGARVACRTVPDTGALAVLCLAFPLHPPGRPDRTRQPELDAVRLPVLVVQGESDPFGLPAPGPNRTIVTVRGNHSLATDLEAVAAAVRSWLAAILASLDATRTAAPRAR